jgi:hypothetical protein
MPRGYEVKLRKQSDGDGLRLVVENNSAGQSRPEKGFTGELNRTGQKHPYAWAELVKGLGNDDAGVGLYEAGRQTKGFAGFASRGAVAVSIAPHHRDVAVLVGCDA